MSPNAIRTMSQLLSEIDMLRQANEAAVRQEQINRNECNRLRGLVEEMAVALEESVKLQSHYAKLLNMHDGGRRLRFLTGLDWMMRLRETGKLPPANGTKGTQGTDGSGTVVPKG